MGAREVWQMFPSVIPSHDFTLFFFFSSQRVKENVPFHFSPSFYFLYLKRYSGGCDIEYGSLSNRLKKNQKQTTQIDETKTNCALQNAR